MYAIIETGSKQYKVEKDDIVNVELLGKNPEESVEFDKIVLLNNDGDLKIGQPYIAGAKVLGKVIALGRNKKVTTFKYKNKTNYHRTKGHKQRFTSVKIESISS